MKFGLCLALVVLLASANVFADENIEMNVSTSENLDTSSMSNIEQEPTTPLSVIDNETIVETSTGMEMNTVEHKERSDLPDEKPLLRSLLPDEKPRLRSSSRTRTGSLNREPSSMEEESSSKVSSKSPTGSMNKISKPEQNERLGLGSRRAGGKKVSAVAEEAALVQTSTKSEERLRLKNLKNKIERKEQSVETGNESDLVKEKPKLKTSSSLISEQEHAEEQSHAEESSHKSSSASSSVQEHAEEGLVEEEEEEEPIKTATTGPKKTSSSIASEQVHAEEQSHAEESSHKSSSASSSVQEHAEEGLVEEEEEEPIKTATTGPKKTSSSVVSEHAHAEEQSHVKEASHKSSSSSSSVTEHVEEDETVSGKRPTKVVQLRPSATTDFPILLKNLVRVTGSISIAPNRESLVGSVQYDIKGGRWNKKNIRQSKLRLPNELNSIAPGSEVMIYVSTVNTFDRRQAFVNFSIPLNSDRFPLEFNIDITLPNAQRRLLQSADIVLYFYAYVWDPETRLESFVPEGVSQVLLQGTNQVLQRVDVFVKPNGLELKGLFNGLYGEKFIRPGTTYQILIIAEESISRLISGKVDYVAQILISNVPAIYPFPFTGIVPYQKLKEGTRYYAAIYIFENGVERLLTSVPILVINEKRVVVTTELIVNVFPFPLILHGTITRSMPGSFHFEQNSSVILSIYEIESESPPSTFRLNSIDRLPQDFEVNISRWSNFDVMKRYEVQATVVDSKNQIYMANRQKVALQTTSARITIPVDDLFYHVHATFHSSLNQPLTYISGSEAVLLITDNPETTSTPLFDARFDPDEFKSTGYLMKISMDTIQRVRNAYLILMVNSSGTITHVSKILLISNGQQPALHVELPVIALSLIRGQIVDSENLPAQWSPLSYATVQLIDDSVEDLTKAIVQVWKIYLERDFPINFNVHLDFSLLQNGHSYSLQAYIETSPKVFWYKPVDAVRVIEPEQRIQDNIRLTVESVMTHQLIQGVVYLDEVADMISADNEVVIQLSSTSSLEKPDVLYETHVMPKTGELKVNFVFNVSLERIDINSIYYFTIKYVSGSKLIIAPKQAYAFSPRNQISVILRLSKNEQIRITGQALSTGGPLMLPEGSILSLQITDHAYSENATVYADVDLEASPRNQYKFTMYLNSVWLRRNVTLYLRAAILHNDEIILSIPRPAPIQIVPGTEWNINLRIDLPTLLIGYISLLGEEVPLNGDFDAYVQILASGTENVISTTRLRMGDNWPQPIRVEVDNVLFAQYSKLEARALIKNCKEELLFRSAGNVAISSRLNVDINLPIVVHDPQLLKDLSEDVSSEAPLSAGAWSVSITGTSASGSGEPVAEIDEEEGQERK